MRTHDQIIVDAGGPTVVARQVGARPGTVKQWRRAGSIPAPYWQALALLKLASLDELAGAVAKAAVVAGGHEGNMAPDAADGAENPERNVSRTDEPGSSLLAPALDHAGASQPIGQADPVQSAAGNDAVVAATSGATLDASAHGDLSQSVAGAATAGFGKFRGAEVLDADFDPSFAAASAHGLHTEAVAVTDVDHGASEASALSEFGRHGASVRDTFAGIGQNGRGEEAGGGDKGDSEHDGSLDAEPYREVSA